MKKALLISILFAGISSAQEKAIRVPIPGAQDKSRLDYYVSAYDAMDGLPYTSGLTQLFHRGHDDASKSAPLPPPPLDTENSPTQRPISNPEGNTLTLSSDSESSTQNLSPSSHLSHRSRSSYLSETGIVDLIFCHAMLIFLLESAPSHDHIESRSVHGLLKRPEEFLGYDPQTPSLFHAMIEKLIGNDRAHFDKIIRKAAKQQEFDLSQNIISKWWGFGNDWFELLAAINVNKIPREAVMLKYAENLKVDRQDITTGLDTKITQHSTIITKAAEKQRTSQAPQDWCGFDMSDDEMEKKVLLSMITKEYVSGTKIVSLYGQALGDYQHKEATLDGFQRTLAFDQEVINSIKRSIHKSVFMQGIRLWGSRCGIPELQIEAVARSLRVRLGCDIFSQLNIFGFTEVQWENLLWLKNISGTSLSADEIVKAYQRSLQSYELCLGNYGTEIVTDLRTALESNKPYPSTKSNVVEFP